MSHLKNITYESSVTNVKMNKVNLLWGKSRCKKYIFCK